MNIRFDGKTTVITGAARGLGRGIAMEMARSGSDIIIGDLLDEEGRKTCEEIKALGVNAKYVHFDVTSPEDCEKLMKSAPQLDIVINVAGIVVPQPLLTIKQEDIERLFEVNTLGSDNIVRAALPIMMERRKGKIMLISSLAARLPTDYLVHYAMSKSAVHSLVMSAALTAAPYGITVNGLCPGIIRTKMWEDILDEIHGRTGEDREAIWERIIGGKIPLGREQTEEDIANAVVFMVSEQGSAINGQSLNVDGGQRMWF